MNEVTLSAPVTAEDHAQGPVDAAVTLVQYGDYECPYTRRSLHSVHTLQREMGPDLRFVYRNFPLEEIHPHARVAAESAEAADAQGQFWPMHAALFDHQQALEATDIERYAADLGLDVQRLRSEVVQRLHAARVDRDLDSGEDSGVEGTPTFFINSVRHAGPFDVDALRQAIQVARQT